MPRYFFDVYDNNAFVDEHGQDLPDIEAARQEAMHTLPRLAYDKIPQDGDRQSFVVMVKDEAGHGVYSATLSYVGLKLRTD